MPWIALLSLALLAFLVVVGSAARTRGETAPGIPPVTSVRMTALSKSEIEQMLSGLKTEERRYERTPTSAMCYARAAPPPDVFEYVCPVCGEKTVYAGERAEYVRAVTTWARTVRIEVLLGGAYSIDASAFCAACNPSKERPYAYLVEELGGGSKRRALLDPWDVQLLLGFGEGRLKLYDDETRENTVRELRRLLIGKPETRAE